MCDAACLIEDPETKRLRPRNYPETLEERLANLEDRRPTRPPDASNASNPPTPALSVSHNTGIWPATFKSDDGVSGTSDLPASVGLLDV